MNTFVNIKSNPFTIDANPYFTNPIFGYKFKDSFLKLGNNVSEVILSITIRKNGIDTVIPHTLNIGLDYFNNELLKEEIISYTDENITVDIPLKVSHNYMEITASLGYSYLRRNDFESVVLYSFKINDKSISEIKHVSDDNQSLFSMNYTEAKVLKLRHNDGSKGQVREVKDGVETFSNLIALINLDDYFVRFNTEQISNPYNLNTFTFEIVDQDDNLINIQELISTFEIKRN